MGWDVEIKCSNEYCNNTFDIDHEDIDKENGNLCSECLWKLADKEKRDY